MNAVAAAIEPLPEAEREAAIDDALELLSEQITRRNAARMAQWSVWRLAQHAGALRARAIVTSDPTMPNGLRIEFETLQVPAAFRSEKPA
ncbi:MAG TPA: hypothetical protein PLX85_00085 [Dehalococcoidia bacterium]|nr:hypothetical protein [Dehalococcoidia bacterium]